MKRELEILFDVLCDGLRQEVRYRYNMSHLAPGQSFYLTDEREKGVASSLALHLRLAGFFVQLETYFFSGSLQRSPDFGIWLPASKEYVFLELKQPGWGEKWSYDFNGAIDDIEKLNGETDQRNQRNGLIALGFSKLKETQKNELQERFEKLSRDITDKYLYERIGLERIDLQDMDDKTSYAMMGLWFRKSKPVAK